MHETLLDEATYDANRAEIVEISNLLGSTDPSTAQTLFYMNSTGMRARYARFHLQRAQIVLEPGALHRMVGQLEMTTTSNGGVRGMFGRAMLSQETLFLNTISGTGTVMLEPTFGHLLLMEMSQAEGGIIVDKGMFLASLGGVKVEAALQRNISSAFFGGEGFFQTLITGKGIVTLQSPVPADEIEIHHLKEGETLKVDGNFALLRSQSVGFSVEKSSRSWMQTAVSGEGLLQTFKGPGQVWLAPTQDIYERLSTPQGIASLHLPPGRRSTTTGNGS